MKLKFKKAVDTGDLISTRLFLANEMMLDPRGKSFLEMRTYAEKTCHNLYETHDGSSFDLNKENWNENLLFSIKNDLDSNFSRERLDYYCNLAKEVLKDKAMYLDAEKCREQGQAQLNNTTNNEEHIRHSVVLKKNVYYYTILCGTVLIIIGIFIEKTAAAYALSSFGVLGIIAGGYLLYNNK